MSLSGKLVFTSGKFLDYDLWTLDLDGNGVPEQITFGENLNESPRWAPDGSDRIAFIRTAPEEIPSLCAINADGSNLQQLSTGIFCKHPFWSPDAKEIFFCGNAENRNEIDIFRLNLETKKISAVLRLDGQEQDPSLSPCGQYLLFSAPEPGAKDKRNMEIWRYDLSSGSKKRLTDHHARDYAPMYSPCGNYIAFVSHREGFDEVLYEKLVNEVHTLADKGEFSRLNDTIKEIIALEPDSDLFIMKADGSEVRQLTSHRGADTAPTFSPCGKYLAYASSKRGNTAVERLHVLEIASGDEQELRYDRSGLMSEVGVNPERYLNKSLLSFLTPNFIEKRFVDPAFFAEERQPDWTK